MLQALRRHPLPMRTRFGHSLVLTYALPTAVLEPLLPPGLTLDTYGPHGFVAVGVVSTRGLRPAQLPAGLGMDAVLTGYRIFTRFPTPGGKTMRGLYILRSDTGRVALVTVGNVLSAYRYHLGKVGLTVDGDTLTATVDSRDGGADLTVTADLASTRTGAPLPPGSPFPDAAAARRFAGPLPYTFHAERDAIVVVKAHRSAWTPVPVTVQVTRCTFLQRPPFTGAVLAQAFHVADLDYGWHRGVRRALDGSAR